MDKEEIARLLIMSQKGDRNALEKLCKESEQLMRNYFLFKFKDIEIVNDLCQETYTRLIKSLPNIREPIKYKNFLLKTSFYVIQDYLRKNVSHKNNKRSIDDLMDTTVLIDKKISVDDQVISKLDLQNALKKLPEKSQLILKLQSEGYKYLEIAEELNLTESAVKMQVKRSLMKLNDLLFK
jgi:RNA polymerase sigma factor (sigma-70 family)